MDDFSESNPSILFILEFFIPRKWSPSFEVTYIQFIDYVHTRKVYIFLFRIIPLLLLAWEGTSPR